MKKIDMLVWNEFTNDARVLKEAETLQAVGYKVCVHALYTPGVNLQKETLDSGIEVQRVIRSPFWRFRKKTITASNKIKVTTTTPKTLPLYKKIIKVITRGCTHLNLLFNIIKHKPDFMHAHDVNVLPTAWLASKILGIPLVYDAHEISTSREGYTKFRKIVGYIEKKITPNLAGMITTTDTRAKFFSRTYKIKRPVVLQNRPRFSKIEEKSDYLRVKLKLNENWPIALYQGGLQSGRGLFKLIKAASKVNNLYLVLVGGGRDEYLLKKLVKELDSKGRIKFIPTVSLNELAKITSSADIGIQPIENTCLNHYSTDSNKLFEYILAGLPVIASDLPEINKIVTKYQVGKLVKHDSESDLTSILNDFSEGKLDMNTYRKNVLNNREKMSWEEQEHKLIDLYKNIA